MRSGTHVAWLAFVAAFAATRPALARPEPARPTHRQLVDKLQRLAAATQDRPLLTSFAERRGSTVAGLAEADLDRLVEHLESTGSPDRALRMLESRTQRFPGERDGWLVLAKVHARAGDTPAALRVWKEIDQRFGLTAEQASTYARLASSAGDHARALAVLAAARATAPEDAAAFWADLAQVAWELDAVEEATDAHRRLWRGGARTRTVAHRLVTLLAESGALDEAASVAREAQRVESDPALLAYVARLQFRNKDVAGARRTLDLEGGRIPVSPSYLDYWLLRAEVLAQFGDDVGTRYALRRALEIDPDAPGARATLLWGSILREDRRTLAADLSAWAPRAGAERDLWEPVAIGLDRVGRTREAMPFFVARMREAPHDHAWALELAGAAERTGDEILAGRIRRGAFADLRRAALEAVRAGARGDDHLLETHAILSRQLLGEPEGDRWLGLLLARERLSPEVEDLAIGWFLERDQLELARRQLQRARGSRPALLRYRLQLAMADEDRAEVRRLATARGLPDAEVAAALLHVEDDEAAVQPILRALDDPGAGGAGRAAASASFPEADTGHLRSELRRIREQRAPTVTLGGSYDFVDGLAGVGPLAGASHAAGGARLFYGAAGRRLEDLGTATVLLPEPRLEAEAGVLARFSGPRRVTEVGVGVVYLTDTAPDAPLPRASYFDVLQASRTITLQIEAHANRTIGDTSFLRVAGLRSVVDADVVYEPNRRVVLIGSALAQEDHTRSLKLLAGEVGGSLEASYRILSDAPDWTVGLRGGAYERVNRATIPDEYRTLPRPNEGIDSLLPPSFQNVMFTTHLARGDFFQRARRDRVPFPRYDCELDAGVLFGSAGGGGPAPAGSARCGGSFRVAGGFVTAAAEYIKGVAGIAEVDNARLLLSFTQLVSR